MSEIYPAGIKNLPGIYILGENDKGNIDIRVCKQINLKRGQVI